MDEAVVAAQMAVDAMPQDMVAEKIHQFKQPPSPLRSVGFRE
jgi:hypothetical protein